MMPAADQHQNMRLQPFLGRSTASGAAAGAFSAGGDNSRSGVTARAPSMVEARNAFASPDECSDFDRDEAADVLLRFGDWCDIQTARQWQQTRNNEPRKLK